MTRKNIKRNILVTGGVGYIGSHTVVELAVAGYRPVIVDNLCNSDRLIFDRINQLVGYPVPFSFGDCTDGVFMRNLMKQHGPFDGIIHFAALKAVQESVEQPIRYYRNNVDGLLTILESLPVEGDMRFVFSSSCTVYGQPDSLPVREDTVLKDSECTYGETKRVSERILKDVVASRKNFKAVSLRYFNPIGAHESGLIGELPLGVPKNLVPFVTQAARGERREVTIFGNDYDTSDGTCVRDYIHVVDVARAHVAALAWMEGEGDVSRYEVFNIGMGRGFSVLEVVQAFEKVNGVRVPYKFGPRRPGDAAKIWADVSRVSKALRWKAGYSLEDALRHVWLWESDRNKP